MNIFNFVYYYLHGISYITGFTYDEVNIIVYYCFIPISWIYLYELPKKKFKFTVSLLIFLLICIIIISLTQGFKAFSSWLFVKSENFLNAIPFTSNPNYDYAIASVFICVFIPVIIYILLFKNNLPILKKHWKLLSIIFIVINLIVGYGVSKIRGIF